MNEFPVDADERPLFPPKILSTEVLLNPFEDIVPRESKRAKPEPEKHETKPKSEAVAKRLANSLFLILLILLLCRDMKVLSFGEDEEETVPQFKKPRMKSSHFYDENSTATVPSATDTPSIAADQVKTTTTTTTTVEMTKARIMLFSSSSIHCPIYTATEPRAAKIKGTNFQRTGYKQVTLQEPQTQAHRGHM